MSNRVEYESKRFKKFLSYNEKIESMFPIIGRQFKDITRMIICIQKQIDELKRKDRHL